MAAVRGIFSISDATFLKKNNYWTNLSEVWVDQIPNTGYFGGGFTTVAVSTMDKIFYSTDTRSTIFSAPLNVSDYYISSVASSNSGYFGGGLLSSLFTKVNYSLDNTLAVPGVSLSLARYGLSATGNSTAGYFGGGFTPGAPSLSTSTMDKVTYSTDTTATVPGAVLSISRGYLAASASTTAGYFGGGSNVALPAIYSTTDKLTYSTDTTAAVTTGALSQQIYGLAATGSITAGYFGGGFSLSTSSMMDKITYSSDTRSSVFTGRLFTSRTFLSATGSSSSGYFAGGGSPSPVATRYDLIEKLSFSTETQLNLSFIPAGGTGARLSSTKYGHAASSAKANALTQNNWRRFSDGTTTTNPASLPPATPTPSSLNVPVSTPNTGYFGSGISNTGSVTTVDKLTYSTETTAAVPGAFFTVALQGAGGVGNSTDGYFLASRTIVQKVTYSTDTRSTTSFFPAGSDYYRSNGAGTGNSTVGYMGGGLGPLLGFPGSTDNTNNTNKILYVTETWSAPGSAYLSAPRSDVAATGNTNFGYFCGGLRSPGTPDLGVKSIVERLTYVNDTTEVLPSTTLPIARSGMGGVGDSSFGYFGGGSTPTPAYLSTVDKLTYSSETLTSIPGAALSSGRTTVGATGNSTSGYFSGGFETTVRVSTTDKITYSTDTRATVAPAALSTARNLLGATSARSNNLPQPTYTLVYRNIV